MEVDRVAVRPGITPATRIVAPNSPNARANARMNPAMIPLRAKGSVIVEITRNGLAPKLKATCSNRGFTSSNATLAVLTNNGNDITAIASTTAFQVKTMSKPIQLPSQPFFPNKRSNNNPVATGGMTRGRVMKVSMRLLPLNEYRASNHAMNNPGGRMNKAARNADFALNQTI